MTNFNDNNGNDNFMNHDTVGPQVFTNEREQMNFEEYKRIFGFEYSSHRESQSAFLARMKFGSKLNEVLRSRGVQVSEAAANASGIRAVIRSTRMPTSIQEKRWMQAYHFGIYYSFGAQDITCGKWYSSPGAMFLDALAMRGMTISEFTAKAKTLGIGTSGIHAFTRNRFVSEERVNQWLGVIGYYLHVMLTIKSPDELREYFNGLKFAVRSQSVFDSEVESLVVSDDYSIGVMDPIAGLPKNVRKPYNPEKIQAKINRIEYGSKTSDEVLEVLEPLELKSQDQLLKLNMEAFELMLNLCGYRPKYTVHMEHTQNLKPATVVYHDLRELISDTGLRVYGDNWESLLSRHVRNAYLGLGSLSLGGLTQYSAALNMDIKIDIVKLPNKSASRGSIKK